VIQAAQNRARINTVAIQSLDEQSWNVWFIMSPAIMKLMAVD